MKKTHLTLAALAALTASATAGDTVWNAPKNPVTIAPAPAPAYGQGWYFGLQGGLNVYQDYQNTNRNGSFRLPSGKKVDTKLDTSNVGGFGGIKLGYGFGGGAIKPALELDAFYNAYDIKFSAKTSDASANGKGRLDSGAFLGNLMFRYDGGRFMPYLGAGAGFFWGQVDDVRLTLGSESITGESDSSTEFAWQILGGFDYFFNPRTSFFTEYKFLNYENPNSDRIFGSSAVRMHLIGVGVRWFF